MCVSTYNASPTKLTILPAAFPRGVAKPTCLLGGFAIRGMGADYIRRCSLRFSHSEKSDGCPTAKLLIDGFAVDFDSVSVNTEMTEKGANVSSPCSCCTKNFSSSGTYFSLFPQA